MGTVARLRVEVLGPIRALDAAGDDVLPDGGLQRRLFALLVLRRGHLVTADATIDVLWPSKLPQDPTAALHNHLFRLRRSLPDGAIRSIGEGYLLDPAVLDLDADRLSAALASDPAAADSAPELEEIEELLARWKGPAYPELGDLDDGRAEALRLDELRLRAQETRAEWRLARGETDGLVAGLSVLADEEPLRERPRALLMATLAAAGRHAEALRTYDDFRRLLADELGIEPSPALAAQHADLLAGTAGTTGTAGTAGVTGTAATAGAVGPGRGPSSRLPVPATSLLGREPLAAELTSRCAEARLVTLVGPGGVGKTRLLVEVGHRLASRRPDRPVVLCELASAETASAHDVIAAALGIDARPGHPLAGRLADVLRGTELVLLLDNCEHVLDPVAEVVELLLNRCPNVGVVATSRERLRVPGERVCTVPTLPIDAGSTAVQLFVDRARAVAPDFDPDEAQLGCVAEIVRRLDGLPLAIELAAARLHTHDVGEVAAGLDHRFALLSSGYRTSSRHGSLGAAVSWSFGLLDDGLQRIFADLSVFCGPFEASDAAAVCGADRDALAQLVERSLVMRAPGRRYLLLETLRAFGGEQLATSGRADLVAERHARHQVDWIERADRGLLQSGRVVLAEIDSAVPELRVALDWLLTHDETELAGRLVVALLDYGVFRLRPDVLAWSERVLDADPADRSPSASRLWAAAAYAAWMAGDVAETGVRSARALRVAAAGGDLPPEVATIQGSYELFEGHLAEAAAWYHRAVDAATAVADPAQRLMGAASEVMALGYAGATSAADLAHHLLGEVAEAGAEDTPLAAYLWYCAGEADLAIDPERARVRLSRALELAERTNASFVTGIAGASKVSIDARIGDPAVAAEDYRRLIHHWRRAGMWSTQWTMLRSIAALLARLGRFHDAAVLHGAVRATGSGHRIFGADARALDELGAHLRASLGDSAYEAARRQGVALDGDAAVEHALRAL